MRANRILQREFEAELRGIHAARLQLVFTAVWTLLRSRRLSLTCLGRAIAERTSPKHGIKRIDRLLGNVHLQNERVAVFRAIARRLIRPGTRPVIIVDWTAVTPGLWALVAAVSFRGRALVIYSETHSISRYLKPDVNVAFLNQLALVLPDRCVPIIVTDAGFRSPWMKLVASLEWDFIGRLRGLAKVRRDRSEAFGPIEMLWRLAYAVPRDLGWFQIGHRLRYPVRIVAVRKKRRAIPIPPRRDFGSERQRRNAHEPWILATSLDLAPSKVVAIYRRRMQVEETFRDAKSSRFGFALSHARTSSEHRANILLLLAALAHVVLLLVGIAAEAADLRGYQANTVRHRRVLSLVTLGNFVVERGPDEFISAALSASAWTTLLCLMHEAIAC